MSIERCNICRELDFGHHVCEPEFQILELPDPDDWGDAHRARGGDAAAAVERWADEHDSSGDYTIVSGSPATVIVRPLGSPAEGEVMIVHGESVPSYRAQPARRLRCSRCCMRQGFDVELVESRCTEQLASKAPRALAGDTEQCLGRLEAAT